MWTVKAEGRWCCNSMLLFFQQEHNQRPDKSSYSWRLDSLQDYRATNKWLRYCLKVKSLWIFFTSYRSPFVPWTQRTRWPGSGLWQHLGIWQWDWNDSAGFWNFNTVDRIKLWGPRPWCHGDPAEMAIKQNNHPALVWTCANNRSLSGGS